MARINQLNGTFAAVAASWQNLLVLLQAAGYTGPSALTQCVLIPVGDLRVSRNGSNATAPTAPTDGIGVGASAASGQWYSWNMAQRGSHLEASQTWIYGDTTNVEFDVTGAEW